MNVAYIPRKMLLENRSQLMERQMAAKKGLRAVAQVANFPVIEPVCEGFSAAEWRTTRAANAWRMRRTVATFPTRLQDGEEFWAWGYEKPRLFATAGVRKIGTNFPLT